jgi:hypothetical protein
MGAPGWSGSLQGVVAYGDDHAEYMQVRIAPKSVHLPAARAGCVFAVQVIEKSSGRDASSQQQCFVAVMAVQPVVLVQMQCQSGHRLMAATRDGEKRLAAIGDLLLELIDPPGGHHCSVKSQLLLSIHVLDLTESGAIRIQAGKWAIRFARATT